MSTYRYQRISNFFGVEITIFAFCSELSLFCFSNHIDDDCFTMQGRAEGEHPRGPRYGQMKEHNLKGAQARAR